MNILGEGTFWENILGEGTFWEDDLKHHLPFAVLSCEVVGLGD